MRRLVFGKTNNSAYIQVSVFRRTQKLTNAFNGNCAYKYEIQRFDCLEVFYSLIKTVDETCTEQ